MRIIVDIGHPAHVHLFKNFIWQMEKREHDILITATEKDITIDLLNNYGFDYIAMGSYGNSPARKMMNIPIMDFKMLRAVSGFKPDMFVGVSTIRATHTSGLMRKPCIVFDDTEHSKWEHILYVPFADVICTPSCFKKDLGKKQVRYNGYHELAYLHPDYFKPDPSVLDELGLKKDDKFVIVRFVAWQASHDIGHYGFNMEAKRKLVKELEKYAPVFITSESPLPEELKNHRLTIPPERIHDLLYYAMMYVGDGGTMASECAALGVPAIYTNTLRLGYLDEQEERYGLIYNLQDAEQVVQKATQLFQQQDLKQEWARKRKRLLKDKIDVTQFMMDFIENYPQSLKQRFMRG